MIPFNRLGFLFKVFGSAIYPREVRDRLADVCRDLWREARILDLGGGTGVLADLAYGARKDLLCIILDPARGMLRYSGPHALKAAGIAEELPFKAGMFDAVLIGDALHHFGDPDQAFSETRRVLKKEGVLFVFDMDPGHFMGSLIRAAEKLLGEPAHFFPPGLLSRLLEGHGFTTRLDRYGWRYSITARSR